MKETNRRNFIKTISAFGLATFIPMDIFGAISDETCAVCKEAWIRLSKLNAVRYQFRYIEPTPNLPKVFLYGDSISIGYTEYVRACLKGKADVYRLHENGSSSHEFIQKMETFRKALFQPDLKGGWNFKWDVIHFNVGLHDLKYVANGKLDKVNGILVSTLEVYENKLRENIKYLKTTYPNAKLVFATTTVVPDGELGRFKGDELKYNKVALKVMEEYPEITVYDLHDCSIPISKEYQDFPGSVHYKADGYRLLGIEVAKQIAGVLQVQAVDCPSATIIEEQFKQYEK